MATEQISSTTANARSYVNFHPQHAQGSRRSHILVVDDDCGVRDTLGLLLMSAGYHLTMATDGIQALQQLKTRPPALLLCDLDLPKMSGVEFLSIVRRRFPEIGVVAMSGAHSGEHVPEAVMADAFYAKGQRTPAILFKIVADIISKFSSDTPGSPRRLAPVWGRTISRDNSGTWFLLVTCEVCLRSFPVSLDAGLKRGVHKAHCNFCQAELHYIADPCRVDDDYFRTTVRIPDRTGGTQDCSSRNPFFSKQL
jgi:CheY-like chemotaxis protein